MVTIVITNPMENQIFCSLNELMIYFHKHSLKVNVGINIPFIPFFSRVRSETWLNLMVAAVAVRHKAALGGIVTYAGKDQGIMLGWRS